MVQDPDNADILYNDSHQYNKGIISCPSNSPSNATATWTFTNTVTSADQWSFEGGLSYQSAVDCNLGVTYTTSSSISVSTSESISTSVPPGWTATPEVVFHYPRHYRIVDQYNASGFAAVCHGYYDDVTNPSIVRDFVLQQNAGTYSGN
jgi:hypothetical protein